MAGGSSGICNLVNRVHICECLKFLKRLPDASIDFCMTSPPYWSMRDYEVKGQIGMEKTPEEYIEKLLNVFRELKRVLKDTGSFYLNLGDTYIGSACGYGQKGKVKNTIEKTSPGYISENQKPPSLISVDKNSWKKPKQLALIPSRVAIALQEDGWILRNDICWFKPNGLPSSVQDRLTNRWEHVFHFVKQRKYYYNLDAIRGPQKAKSIKRVINRMKLQERTGRPMTKISKYYENENNVNYGASGFLKGRSLKGILNLKGKNPGDFWKISVKSFSVPHFAVYPEELCSRPIKSSCPTGGIVFDMFSGSATTLVVAKKLGRRFIGCDLNHDYVRIARKRLKTP
jgi:site-specific DNA-methyltransferase (cytosine-N4-specific)